MPCLRCILNIKWSYKVPNVEVLARAGLPTMFTLLRQCRLCWLGHVHGMEGGRIPKDILYGELASGTRPVGRPKLRYRDVGKRNMRALDINTESWECTAADCSRWRSVLKKQLKMGEEKIQNLVEDKRARQR